MFYSLLHATSYNINPFGIHTFCMYRSIFIATILKYYTIVLFGSSAILLWECIGIKYNLQVLSSLGCESKL